MQLQPFRELLEESLDEAHFLWRRFEQELSSLTRNLDEIESWTEDRLQGALDGVRVAPDQLEALLMSGLAGDDPTQIAVAAHLLATSKSAPLVSKLSDSVRGATGPKLDAMIRGFQVANLDSAFAPITAALGSSPDHKAALCELKAFRRATLGQELVDVYETTTPALQAKALRAAAFLSDQRVDAWIKAGLEHPDAAVRSAAIVTGIRRRNTNAWHAAVQLVRMAHEESAPLLDYVAMFGGAPEHQAVLAAVDTPALAKPALQALGTMGTRAAAERCLSAMRDEQLARAAGEAYCAITGAELERDRLIAPEKDEAPPAFEEDDLNADLVPRGDAAWPLPNPDAVANHWARVQSRFAPGMRHVLGRPTDVNVLIVAIESGPMLRRPQWIFEAAVRTQNKYDVEPRAFPAQQRRMLAAARTRVAA
jgi:uncharacterized protein (TIGR02270 family)